MAVLERMAPVSPATYKTFNPARVAACVRALSRDERIGEAPPFRAALPFRPIADYGRVPHRSEMSNNIIKKNCPCCRPIWRI